MDLTCLVTPSGCGLPQRPKPVWLACRPHCLLVSTLSSCDSFHNMVWSRKPSVRVRLQPESAVAFNPSCRTQQRATTVAFGGRRPHQHDDQQTASMNGENYAFRAGPPSPSMRMVSRSSTGHHRRPSFAFPTTRFDREGAGHGPNTLRNARPLVRPALTACPARGPRRQPRRGRAGGRAPAVDPVDRARQRHVLAGRARQPSRVTPGSPTTGSTAMPTSGNSIRSPVRGTGWSSSAATPSMARTPTRRSGTCRRDRPGSACTACRAGTTRRNSIP